MAEESKNHLLQFPSVFTDCQTQARNIMYSILAGGELEIDVRCKPGYWRDGAWIPCLAPDKMNLCRVNGIAALGENVIAAGHVYRADNPGRILAGMIISNKWSYLPPLERDQDCWAWSAYTHGSDVYVGGACNVKARESATARKEVRIPGYWKNGVWIELPAPEVDGYVLDCLGITSICVASGKIYATGNLRSSGNRTYAGYWQDGVWRTLSKGTSNNVVVYNEDVYVCGRAGESPGYWKNGRFSNLQIPSGMSGAQVHGMAIDNESVYICGVTVGSPVAEPSNPGYWLDCNWNPLPIVDRKYGGVANAIIIANDGVNIGGRCEDRVYSHQESDRMKMVYMPGVWRNGTWTEFAVTENSRSAVLALAGLD